ncbi:MAG: 2-amino-4-hydroxy-6-hydroxymethyldihydropteridine diphosphokinase, partial [Anaerolineales bacterium]
MNNLAYLSLGSNINPEKNLPAAVKLLARYGAIKAVSSVWETAPVGFTEQANFLNAAVLLETSLSAQHLWEKAICEIERGLKRVRIKNKNAPRTIDIDVVLFNRDILSFGHHKIPDADILERAFVAIPLAEIAPEYDHPEVDQTLAEIAAQFDPAAEK